MLLAITISGNTLAVILAPLITMLLLQIGGGLVWAATSRANNANTRAQLKRLEDMVQAHMGDSQEAVTNLARLEVTVEKNQEQVEASQGEIKQQLKTNGEATNQWRATAESRMSMLERRSAGAG